MNIPPVSIGAAKSALIEQYADATLRRRASMLWGSRGVGKSSIVRRVAAHFGVPLVDLRLTTIGPVDIRGAIYAGDVQGKTVWFPPEFLPSHEQPAGILFLDELTAADQRLQVVLRLLSARPGPETAALLPQKLDGLYGMLYGLLAASRSASALARAVEIVEQWPNMRGRVPLTIREAQTLARPLQPGRYHFRGRRRHRLHAAARRSRPPPPGPVRRVSDLDGPARWQPPWPVIWAVPQTGAPHVAPFGRTLRLN